MQAWTKVRDEADGFDLVEHPVPHPGPGEILVRTRATSICGTDLHIWSWDEWSRANVPLGTITGHETSGEVAMLGEGVVDPRWREVVSRWNLFERLAGRVAIDAAVYEELHKGVRERSVVPPTDEFVRSEEAEDDLEGARRYSWISA